MVQSAEADSLLSIENLTTFHDYPPSPGQIIVYTKGYPSHLVTDFISCWLRTGSHTSFQHYGDMDAFGFDILWTLHQRTGADVRPLHMDLQTYEKNKERAIALSPRNIPVFQSLLDTGYFSRETEVLFHRLMEDGLMLEQESVVDFP